MYETFATVWKKGSVVVFPEDASFILQQLTDNLDMFINAYLKANQK